MKQETTFYAVPESVAQALGLTELRRSDGNGYRLLSVGDLRPYGVELAVSDGATVVSAEEIADRFNPIKTFNV